MVKCLPEEFRAGWLFDGWARMRHDFRSKVGVKLEMPIVKAGC